VAGPDDAERNAAVAQPPAAAIVLGASDLSGCTRVPVHVGTPQPDRRVPLQLFSHCLPSRSSIASAAGGPLLAGRIGLHLELGVAGLLIADLLIEIC